jgi:hypothetical protein
MYSGLFCQNKDTQNNEIFGCTEISGGGGGRVHLVADDGDAHDHFDLVML